MSVYVTLGCVGIASKQPLRSRVLVRQQGKHEKSKDQMMFLKSWACFRIGRLWSGFCASRSIAGLRLAARAQPCPTAQHRERACPHGTPGQARTNCDERPAARSSASLAVTWHFCVHCPTLQIGNVHRPWWEATEMGALARTSNSLSERVCLAGEHLQSHAVRSSSPHVFDLLD